MKHRENFMHFSVHVCMYMCVCYVRVFVCLCVSVCSPVCTHGCTCMCVWNTTGINYVTRVHSIYNGNSLQVRRISNFNVD